MASALDLRGERNRVILSELDFPTDGHVWLAWAAKTRRRDRLAALGRRPHDPARGLRRGDRRTHRRGHGEPRALPLERDRGRQGGLRDGAGTRGACRSSTTTTGSGSCRWTCTTWGATCTRRARSSGCAADPGMAFLYARRELLPTLEPAVTGWFATEEPFSFDNQHLDYHPTARRLEHGTPPAPVFFIAQGGLDIISEVGAERVRARQGVLTDHVIARSDEAGLAVRTPASARRPRRRGERAASAPRPSASATRCWRRTSAPTSAATGSGSARTSSPPRTTSTRASTRSGRSSSPTSD